jgi:hypothetical protein
MDTKIEMTQKSRQKGDMFFEEKIKILGALLLNPHTGGYFPTTNPKGGA